MRQPDGRRQAVTPRLGVAEDSSACVADGISTAEGRPRAFASGRSSLHSSVAASFRTKSDRDKSRFPSLVQTNFRRAFALREI